MCSPPMNVTASLKHADAALEWLINETCTHTRTSTNDVTKTKKPFM